MFQRGLLRGSGTPATCVTIPFMTPGGKQWRITAERWTKAPDAPMSLFVLDTDILSLYFHGDPIVVQHVEAHVPAELAISIMTVDEQITGWYTLLRQARQPAEVSRAYAHLGDAVVRLAKWRILPYSEPAIARVAQFRTLRLNVRVMDLRIAAIALENGAGVVTRNVRDFSRVPGLTVEDGCGDRYLAPPELFSYFPSLFFLLS